MPVPNQELNSRVDFLGAQGTWDFASLDDLRTI